MLWMILLSGILSLPAHSSQAQTHAISQGPWMEERLSSVEPLSTLPQGTWDRVASQGEPMPTQGTAGCCEICGAGYHCPRQWTWYNGSKILNRTRTRPELLSIYADGQGALNVDSLGFDVAGGYETRVQYYLGNDRENRDQFIEFVYWGLNEWKDTQTVRGQRLTYNSSQFGGTSFTGGSLFSFYGLLDFNYADMHQIRYQSEINNFELNWWFKPRPRPDRLALLPNGRWQRQCQPGTYINYALGFRSLSFDEGFVFDSRGTIETENGSLPLYARQTIWTQNDTFGFQLAGEVLFRRHRFEWGARVKAAPMFNWAEQTTNFALYNAPNQVRRYGKDDDVAFMGEVSIVANYRIWDRVRIFGAWEMMWLTGVALAPEQVDFTLLSPGRINDNGTVYFQGVSLGFDVVW